MAAADCPALTAFADLAFGNGGNDALAGGAGSDTLDGGSGNESLLGGAGDNRLVGGTGAEVMRGGQGNDTYVVDSAQDAVSELANEGTDTVETTLATPNLLADQPGERHLHGLRRLQQHRQRLTERHAGRQRRRHPEGRRRQRHPGRRRQQRRVRLRRRLRGRPCDGLRRQPGRRPGPARHLGSRGRRRDLRRAVALAQVGANTVVTVGGGTITLANVAAAAVTQADFILAG